MNNLNSVEGRANQDILEKNNIMYKVWWDYEKGDKDLICALTDRAKKLISDMDQFYVWCDYYNWMYETRLHEGTDKTLPIDDRNSLRQSWNIARVAVDAHYNRIIKVAPKVTLLSKDATTSIKHIAEQSDDYLLNLYNRSDFYPSASRAYKDALIANLGVQKIYVNNNKKCFGFRRVLPYSVAFEKPFEGDNNRSEILEYGMYKFADLKRMINKSNMKDKEKLIKELDKHHEDLTSYDTIKVYEMYKKGCKKAIFTDKVIIDYSDWKFDFIPYNLFVWDKKTEGVVGTGVMEICSPGQRKVNSLLYRIDVNTKFFTNQYVILPKNSQFSKMDNSFGNYYEANMQQGKPIHVTPKILDDQVFRHLHECKEMILKVARVSELQAEGTTPAGAGRSGKAMKYYYDIDGSRFYSNVKSYEKNAIDTAKMVLEWGCKKYPNEIPFKDLKGNMDEFLDKVNKFPESLLPENPAGKHEMLEKLVATGMISPDAVYDLMDAPDISGYIRGKSAMTSAVRKWLEVSFLKGGKEVQPDPLCDYQVQKELALVIYYRILKESDKGYDDPKLTRIRKFLKAIKQELDEIKKEQANFLAKGGEFGGETPSETPQAPDPALQSPGGSPTG